MSKGLKLSRRILKVIAKVDRGIYKLGQKIL